MSCLPIQQQEIPCLSGRGDAIPVFTMIIHIYFLVWTGEQLEWSLKCKKLVHSRSSSVLLMMLVLCFMRWHTPHMSCCSISPPLGQVTRQHSLKRWVVLIGQSSQ